MEIYQYDPNNGALLSSSVARANPLEPGEFLLPRFATTIAPPDAEEGKIATFNEEAQAWTMIDDDRGTWYTATGQVLEVIALGARPEIAVTRIEPPAPYQTFNGTSWELDTERKAAADLATLNANMEAQVAAIRDQYPLSEVLTWPKQEQEALAFTADAGASTPLLSAIAAAREVTVAYLAEKVLLKAAAYAAFVGAAIGARQKLEDEMEA